MIVTYNATLRIGARWGHAIDARIRVLRSRTLLEGMFEPPPPKAQIVTVGMITAVVRLMEWARVTARWSKLGKIFAVGFLPLIGDRLTS